MTKILKEIGMKRFKLLLITALAVLMTFCIFSACGEDETPPPTIQYTVSVSSENTEMGTVNCKDASNNAVSSGSKVNENTVVKFTATENTGYEFNGWYSGSQLVSSEKTYQVTVTNDVTLTAKFKAKTFVLTFTSVDTSMGTVGAQNSIASGNAVAYKTTVYLTANANTGYNFDGWYIGTELKSSSPSYSFQMPANAVNLTAKFSIKSFNLTFVSSSAAWGEVTSSTATSGNDYDYNTSITLLASEKTGYDFDGWYEGETKVCSETVYTFNMIKGCDLVAKFVPEKRIVSFYDGYVLIEAVEVDYGTTVDEHTYVRDNHNRIGWFTTPTFDSRYAFDSLVTTSFNLYGQFESVQISYSVLFVKEDGSAHITVQTVYEGDTILHVPPAPIKEGYDFDHWIAVNESTGEEEDFDETKPVTSDLTIKPTYSPTKFDVVFYLANEKTEINIHSAQKVKYKECVTNLKAPYKEDHVFVKWVYFDQPTVEFDVDSLITENVDVLAVFEEINQEETTYTVIFKDDVGNEIDTQTVKAGGNATAPTAPIKVGKTFNGWRGTFTNVQSDLVIVADYSTNKYEVTFKYNGQTETQSVIHGENAVPPTVTDKTGYIFDGWSKQGESEIFNLETPITENITLNAVFNPIKYTVHFVNGLNDEDIYTLYEIPYDTTVSVPATPNLAGYSFINWYTDKTYQTEYLFSTLIKGELSIYAKYEIIEVATYTVTFVTPTGDEISVQDVVEGQSAIAPNAPKVEGYTFVRWDKDFSEITSNLTVVAEYDALTYTVSFYTEDGNELIDSVVVAHGQSAEDKEPTAPPVSGKTFVKWSKDISIITKDIEVTAIYAFETRTVYFDAKNGSDIVEVTVEYGKCVSIPSTPSYPGSVFAGWKKQDDTEIFNFETPITEDITLVATYTELLGVHIVTFYAPDGSVYGNIQIVGDGNKATKPAPYKDDSGKTYIWCLAGSTEEFVFSTSITEDVNLYATEKISNE